MATPRGIFAPELLPEGWFDETTRPEGWFSQDFLELNDAGPSAQTVTGTIFADTDTFHPGILSVGPVTIVGSLYQDTDGFGAGTITQGGAPQTITGTLFSDADTFGAGSLSSSITISGVLYSEPDSFGSGVIVQGGAPQTITGPLFGEVDVFYSGTITQPGLYIHPGPRGWVEYAGTNRTRAGWKKDREEIREAVKSALTDSGHEAKELIAAVEPFIEKTPRRVEFDWSGIRADLQSITDAVRDYRDALEREAAEEAEDIEFLMMVA